MFPLPNIYEKSEREFTGKWLGWWCSLEMLSSGASKGVAGVDKLMRESNLILFIIIILECNPCKHMDAFKIKQNFYYKNINNYSIY